MSSPSAHIGLEPETIAIFVATCGIAFTVDMFLHRGDKTISLKSAVAFSLFWILVAMGFAVFLYFHLGSSMTSLFLSGYAMEMALSVDNLFVMMAIFAWLKVPEKYCHRVLFWGILGAIVFRLIFVAIGTSLFALGPAMEFVFAAVVGLSGLMMVFKKDDANKQNPDLSKHFAVRAVRHFFPVYPKMVGHSFFLSKAEVDAELQKEENRDLKLAHRGAVFVTPLFLCLAIIEFTDVLFAFDSVPAVIAVSREPLIVYSAMMFAVMGLRSMYFVLDSLRRYLVHLEKAVIFLLFFIAFKLGADACQDMFGFGIEITVYQSMAVIGIILCLGVLASLVFPGKNRADEK